MAGQNGSGKTAFMRKLVAGKLPVNSPDDIAEQEGVGAVSAGRLAIQRRRTLLEAEEGVALERPRRDVTNSS